MNFIALKMLLGDRAKYIGVGIGLTFASFLVTWGTVISDNDKRIDVVPTQIGQRLFQTFIRSEFIAARAPEHRSAEM
jgi:hypothetical protein